MTTEIELKPWVTRIREPANGRTEDYKAAIVKKSGGREGLLEVA